MKKIVALVLSLVMVLGLATTAFGAITLWGENSETVKCDIYDGEYNTKLNEDYVEVGYFPGQALKYEKDGSVKQVGVIPHYFIIEHDDSGFVTDYHTFVRVDKIPADADASKYFLVKAHNPNDVDGYEWEPAQTGKDPYYIMKLVEEVAYIVKAEAFTAWSADCEAYPAPLNADEVDYYTPANAVVEDGVPFIDPAVKYAEADKDSDDVVPALVGKEVVLLDLDVTVAATKHAWIASAWDEDGVTTKYTCNNCKTVGTVINASVNAPAGAKIDNFMGTLIAYHFPAVDAPAGDKVESAQTFDAGIAMYVGMSVMAAAGSAVVLKKKD